MSRVSIRPILAAVVAVSCLVASSAFAAPITFQTGNNPLTGSENVLFNEGSLINSGLTVQGILPSDTVVNFTSSTMLNTPSAGAARVAGSSSSFNNLTIALDGSSFSGIIFNLNIANANGGPPDTGTVNFTVNYTDPVGIAGQAFGVSSAGNNFFTIFADAGIDISNIMLSLTGVGALDIRQVRIAETAEDSIPTPVPAPASLLLLGAGLLGLGAARRRRA